MRRAALFALALAGCTQPPRALGDGGNVVGAAPVGPGTRALAPSLVHVAVRGTVAAGAAPSGKLVVVLTDGPCFQPGSHYLATTPALPGGAYQLEAFPPSGTRLEVCAALVVGGQRLTPWHGRAASTALEAAGRGPAVYRDIDIQLVKTTPVRVPDQLKLE